MINLTPQQSHTLATELRRFAGLVSGDVSLIKAEVYPGHYEPGQVSFTFSHPGQKADRSDWSMSSSTINPDGTHFDSDPVKPWELD